MSEQFTNYTQQSVTQNQIQWLNWKCDELYRQLKGNENTAAAGRVRLELAQLQAIGQSLEKLLTLGQIIKSL